VSQDLSDDRVIKALAHPTRRKILLEFDAGTASPKEIAERLELSISNVSYHVTILRKLGLIELKRTTPRRGVVEHHYAARSRTKMSPSRLAGLPSQARSAASRAALRELTPVLQEKHAVVVTRHLRLDEKGEQAADKAIEKLWLELDRIEAAAERRKTHLGDEAPPELVVGLIRSSPAASARTAKQPSR
jgi:DNA-binding transcriptional ArsR family regulator